MRSPGRKRPQVRKVATELSPSLLRKCAEAARYVGSPEHKTYPSFAGPAHRRSDATKCPPHLKDAAVITAWLRAEIARGNVSAHFEEEFPRYVWAFRDGSWFEARLTNSGLGEYKGYPLHSAEVPVGAVE